MKARDIRVGEQYIVADDQDLPSLHAYRQAVRYAPLTSVTVAQVIAAPQDGRVGVQFVRSNHTHSVPTREVLAPLAEHAARLGAWRARRRQRILAEERALALAARLDDGALVPEIDPEDLSVRWHLIGATDAQMRAMGLTRRDGMNPNRMTSAVDPGCMAYLERGVLRNLTTPVIERLLA